MSALLSHLGINNDAEFCGLQLQDDDADQLHPSSLAQVYRQRISKRGRNEGVGKHKRERNGEHGNWRPLKASRGGVYLRRSERSDKWRGDAFVRHRQALWVAYASLVLIFRSLSSRLLPLCRVDRRHFASSHLPSLISSPYILSNVSQPFAIR